MDKDQQTALGMATDALKRIVSMATGTDPATAHLSDAKRLKSIADMAQMTLDVFVDPKPDSKWSKPIAGLDRPLCPNGHGEMVPKFGGYIYLCPQCGTSINAPTDQGNEGEWR